ncbi:MAG TPA: hypothetical protein VGR37_04790 [Longimicrobiaceae bacterium]|nr:hypothetical protein [Longimicrobiaceae bacterium]
MIRSAALALAALCLAPAAPAAAQQPTQLDGIYYGLRTNLVTKRINQAYLTFLPDGRVASDDPAEGLAEPVDFEGMCRYGRCGSYQVRGSEVRIRWREGGEEVYDRGASGELKQRGRNQSYRPVALLDGMRLDGEFAIVDPQTGRAVVGIRFGPDGEFLENNLMGFTNWEMLARDGERRVALPLGYGRYSIHRNTLELRYEGGPVARFVILIPPGQPQTPAARTLIINQAVLPRVR